MQETKEYLLIVNTEGLTSEELDEVKAYLLTKGCSI